MDPNVWSCFNWKYMNTKAWAPPTLESGPIHCCISAPRIILTSGMISKCICKKVNYISCSPWGHKESDTAEWLSTHTHKLYLYSFVDQGQRLCSLRESNRFTLLCASECLSVVCDQKTSNHVKGCVMFIVTRVVQCMILFTCLFVFIAQVNWSGLIIMWSLCQKHHSKLSAI